jgi:CheY-like chemotaxis protein
VGARVLVVDDEEAILLAVSDYLALRGFQVDSAGSRAAACAMLARNRYAAVIADLCLSVSDRNGGFEVLSEAHRLSETTRTLLLTAYPSPDVDQEAQQRSIDLVLVKPVPLGEVARAVQRIIRDDGATGDSP